MDQKKIAQRSAELVMRYYDNDVMPFLESFDDDALWYGPLKGQFIKGREAMIRAWEAEEHELTFTVGNLQTRTASAHPSFCDCMATYSVVTHYPNGEDIFVEQRTLLTWAERRVVDEGSGQMAKVARILLCHISNPTERDDRDVIYPAHYGLAYTWAFASPRKGERIHFVGQDRTDYFLLSDSIIWIESAGSKHSVVHTTAEDVRVLSSLSSLASSHAHLFLRCHQSYLVNPDYIKGIRRFKLALENGVELPVPEKKYTAIKKDVMDLLT